MKGEAPVKELCGGLLKGDVRALSRLMTRVENEPEVVPEVMGILYGGRKRARRVGLSGPPGAGKSTLLANMVRAASDGGAKVGVLCIDPTSPVSGGAILGDRVRIGDMFAPEKVFIRSVASGDSLGGVAGATKLHAILLEAAGCDLVLIETVGIGQVGYDIREIVETLVLVLVPESGDTIQTLKSGIMELADIVVVNKSDREGAEHITDSLKNVFMEPRNGWATPVVNTVARDDKGTGELMRLLDEHAEYRKGAYAGGELQDVVNDFNSAVVAGVAAAFDDGRLNDDAELAELRQSVVEGKIDPYTAAGRAVGRLLGR